MRRFCRNRVTYWTSIRLTLSPIRVARRDDVTVNSDVLRSHRVGRAAKCWAAVGGSQWVLCRVVTHHRTSGRSRGCMPAALWRPVYIYDARWTTLQRFA